MRKPRASLALLLLAAAALSPGQAPAEEATGTVRGWVVDSTSHGAKFVEVVLEGPAVKEPLIDATDEFGAFLFDGIPAGKWTRLYVKSERLGLESEVFTSFEIKPGESRDFLIHLKVPEGAEAPPPQTGTTEGFLEEQEKYQPTRAENSIPMSLGQCIEAGLASNLDISISRFSLRSSEESIRSAKGVFDPLLNFSAGDVDSTAPRATALDAALSTSKVRQYSLNLNQLLYYGASYGVSVGASRSETNNPFATSNPTYSGSLTLSYSQPLLRNFGRRATLYGLRLAKNNLAISDEAFRQQVIATVKAVVYAYWDVFAANEALLVSHKTLDLARDQLRQNRIMVDVGTLPPIDVTQAEAQVASAVEAILVAENALRAAEDNLRLLVNYPPESPVWSLPIYTTDRPPEERISPDLDAAVEQALHNRPEIRQMDLDLKNRQLGVDYRRNQILPQLDLALSRTYSGLSGTVQEPIDTDGDTIADLLPTEGSYSDAFDDVWGREYDTTAIELLFSYPIPNRSAKAALADARLRYDSGLAEKEQLVDAIRVEVRAAVRDVETDKKRIEAARANRYLSEKQLDAEQKKFENGMSTNFQVLTYQSQLATARLREISAVIGYAKDIADYQSATGTLLEELGIDIATLSSPAPGE